MEEGVEEGFELLCLLFLLERRWKRHRDDLSVSAQKKKKETSQQLRGVNALIMCVVLGSARGDLLNSKRGSGEGEECEMRGMEGYEPSCFIPRPNLEGSAMASSLGF